MKQVNVNRAILGGFGGTLIMTVLLYVAPLVGAPKMDIAALLGSILGHGAPAMLSLLWWAGMVWHFVNGTVIFSLIYSYFVYGWLPGENWLRGTIWGLVLWIAMEVTLMPMTGSGVFSDHATYAFPRVVGSLVLNAIYGALLGRIAGVQAEHTHHVPHPA
jgi:uncharacterized membrane protein YagU involved in acid resistance